MGSGVRQGLNWDDIKRLQILVPPQSEQQQIASFLDRKCAEIDSVIADTQVLALILFILSIPTLIGCLLVASGIILLVPVGVVVIAFSLLKACV